MYSDEFKHQLPDIDPGETADWVASFDDLVDQEGADRARFVMYKLLKRARQLHVGLPPLTQTRYINTISPEQEPYFPGDEAIERRIRRLVRWNAVAMVLRANSVSPGIGGHLSTYASSASLYEVAFNWFFRGKDDGSGDQIFYQGHAAPGMYARAFLEGRLSADQLDHFRREVRPGQGLSSYPHPRLMPDFWEFPTVSMGLGPIAAIYQARFNRYLLHRGIADTSSSRVWAFLGDGEMDEPEALGALWVAGRDGTQAHAHGRELPEVGHEARVRVRREALSGAHFATEVVQLVGAQAPLEECPGVHPRRRVPLVEDLVPTPLPVLAAEEVVEPDLVQARGRGIGRQVATQAGEAGVRPEDHRDRVPADDPADPELDRLVAREVRLLLRADRVDVAGLGQRRQPDVELSGALQQLEQDETRPLVSLLPVDLVQRVEPLLSLGGVDVGQLVLELVEVHRSAGSELRRGGEALFAVNLVASE